MKKRTKFKLKYAKELANGLRLTGYTIPEVCRHWGISVNLYRKWIEDYPVFAEAHELGERDEACYWADVIRGNATGDMKGNASVVNLASKNITGIGWSDKVEVHRTSDEEIRTIRIEVLPTPEYTLPPAQTRIIDVNNDSDTTN
jgi:hypothetical protein